MVRELEAFCPGEWQVFPAIREPDGKIGISKSLRRLLQLAKEQALPSMLVFEDDVRFCSPRAREHWELCVADLPGEWDLLLGGAYSHSGVNVGPRLKRLSSFCSLHCALFNHTAYDKVQEHRPESGPAMGMHIDVWLSGLGLKVYLCDPQIAIQYNGFSDTVKAHTNYDSLVSRMNLLP